MARTARRTILKRSCKKEARKSVDFISIKCVCGQLTVSSSLLRSQRRYRDEAVDWVKTTLKEKLASNKIQEVKSLLVATPDHHSDFLELFRNFHIDNLMVAGGIETLEKDCWLNVALQLEPSHGMHITLSNVTPGCDATITSVVGRLITEKREATLELLDERAEKAYIDTSLINDEFLLETARWLQDSINLKCRTTLITTKGILGVVEMFTGRAFPCKIVFSVHEPAAARKIKEELLEYWKLKEVVDENFKELNPLSLTPIYHEQYTLANIGCESIAVFDTKMLVCVPTEFVLSGRLKIAHPMDFRIERVIDPPNHPILNREAFDLSQR